MAIDIQLFVYGSLMRGYQYHDVLGIAEFISVAKTEPAWMLLDLGEYPAVTPGNQRIEGELYIVDEQTIRRLDRLEGCPDFYRRELVTLEGGQQAAMYILQPSAVPIEPVVITDGSWRRWRGRQSG